MDNLEQQLQQLRLIHNRITTNTTTNNEANAIIGGKLNSAVAASSSANSSSAAMVYGGYGYGNKKQGTVAAAVIVADDANVEKERLRSVVNRKTTTKMGLLMNSSSSNNKQRHDTLDNPLVLDQQLEALAHHKRQMEKRGLLNNQQKQQQHYNNININKDLLQQHQKITTHKNLYKGSPTTTTAPHIAKSLVDLQAQHKNVNNDEEDDDDNETSPPSPVSSSYSELRHAAESSTLSQQQQQHMMMMMLPSGVNNSSSATATYMNLAYAQNNSCTPTTTAIGGAGAHSTAASNNIINQQDCCTDYYDFGNFSQSSSTYESIYEPINPRPTSQLSNISSSLANNHRQHNHNHHNNNNKNNNTNKDMAACYANLMSNSSSIINLNKQQQLNNTTTTNSSCCSSYNDDDDNEANRECGYDTEDTLTDYLERSNSSNLDYNECENYGICCKCNERVIGENSGCTAMDNIYHIECFTCTQCQINLQGKPFYAIDNKAYCEYDYLQTLEKCSVCTKPILERILRATGKPYHPQCFTCVVCGKSLDGIQFTVDATNQNYCITDFHKKFAPRCCVCKQPIMPESGEEETVRVVALDRSFHLKCYKCEDCGLLLSSNSEGRGCYPLDDHVLCKSCNAKRVQILTSSDL